MRKKYFAEFFAGIGLVHAGLEASGWTCVYANDIDPKKREMYGHRFGDLSHYHLEDIWQTEEVLKRLRGPVDLVTASFPCVDLSQAGKGKGLRGKSSGAFFGFLEVIRGLKSRGELPPQLLIENVMGFLSSRSGEDFRLACQGLSELGYWLDAVVIDAKHFTPQSRPRLFIIGSQAEYLPHYALNPRLTNGSEAEDPLRPVRLRKILASLELRTGIFRLAADPLPPEQRTIDSVLDPGPGDWWSPERVHKHLSEMSTAHREIIESFRDKEGWTLGTMYRRVRKGKSRTEIRTDGLAGCLRTPRGGSSKQMVYAVGGGKIQMRWMSPGEYAALQGAADFPLKVSNHQALFGFGDAVCVPALSWIAEQFCTQLIGRDAN